MVELKNERTSREAAEAQYRQVVQLIEGARFDVPKKMDSQVNTDPTAAEAKELRKEVKQLRERLREADSHCAEAERKRKDAAEGHQHAITELAAFRNAYQDLSNKNHDLDEQVTRLKAVNKEQKNKLRAFEAANQIVEEKKVCGANSKSEGCKKRCRQISLDPMQTDVERIRRQYDDLKATARCLQKKNSDLERSLAAESARVNELKRTLECTQRKSDKLVEAANQQKDALIHKVEVLQQDNRNLAEMLAKASTRAEECGALQEQLQRAQAVNDDLREELRQTVQRATTSRIRAILLEKELEGHNNAVPDLQRKIAQLEDDLKQTEQRASSLEIQAALRLSALTERRKQLEDANRVIEQLQNSTALAELQQRATSAEVRAIVLESVHRKEMDSVKQHVERLEAKLMARNDLVAELSIKLRGVSGALGEPSKHKKNEPTETPV
ncbi:hypothetical protein AAVH_03420 [Aphelenchoides avenae]|nr:hypothetical protein AAVH_03420 [Aphelenchus avenae]